MIDRLKEQHILINVHEPNGEVFLSLGGKFEKVKDLKRKIIPLNISFLNQIMDAADYLMVVIAWISGEQ